MKRSIGAALVVWFAASGGPAPAQGQDARAVVDKAIAAVGGEESLARLAAITWKSRGKISFNDNENDFTIKVTAQGLDRHRSEFDGEFNGNPVKVVAVLAGDKGWRKINDESADLDADALANEKRNVYLQLIPATLVALKGKGFKLGEATEEKVGEKPAVAVKVTGPDGKDFKLSFDKEGGLLLKLTATVVGFGGEEADQETTFGAYKDLGGIKKATKIETRRDGRRFIEQEITEFKALEKVEPGTFDEPK